MKRIIVIRVTLTEKKQNSADSGSMDISEILTSSADLSIKIPLAANIKWIVLLGLTAGSVMMRRTVERHVAISIGSLTWSHCIFDNVYRGWGRRGVSFL
jgi:hypothetical protein